MNVRATAAVFLLAATSTQLVGGAVASAAPRGRQVVLDPRTGGIVRPTAVPDSRLVVLDVRTGKVVTMTAQPGPGDGSEFFLDRSGPVSATAVRLDYAGDGSEFRTTR